MKTVEVFDGGDGANPEHHYTDMMVTLYTKVVSIGGNTIKVRDAQIIGVDTGLNELQQLFKAYSRVILGRLVVFDSVNMSKRFVDKEDVPIERIGITVSPDGDGITVTFYLFT